MSTASYKVSVGGLFKSIEMTLDSRNKCVLVCFTVLNYVWCLNTIPGLERGDQLAYTTPWIPLLIAYHKTLLLENFHALIAIINEIMLAHEIMFWGIYCQATTKSV